MSISKVILSSLNHPKALTKNDLLTNVEFDKNFIYFLNEIDCIYGLINDVQPIYVRSTSSKSAIMEGTVNEVCGDNSSILSGSGNMVYAPNSTVIGSCSVTIPSNLTNVVVAASDGNIVPSKNNTLYTTNLSIDRLLMVGDTTISAEQLANLIKQGPERYIVKVENDKDFNVRYVYNDGTSFYANFNGIETYINNNNIFVESGNYINKHIELIRSDNTVVEINLEPFECYLLDRFENQDRYLNGAHFSNNVLYLDVKTPMGINTIPVDLTQLSRDTITESACYVGKLKYQFNRNDGSSFMLDLNELGDGLKEYDNFIKKVVFSEADYRLEYITSRGHVIPTTDLTPIKKKIFEIESLFNKIEDDYVVDGRFTDDNYTLVLNRNCGSNVTVDMSYLRDELDEIKNNEIYVVDGKFDEKDYTLRLNRRNNSQVPPISLKSIKDRFESVESKIIFNENKPRQYVKDVSFDEGSFMVTLYRNLVPDLFLDLSFIKCELERIERKDKYVISSRFNSDTYIYDIKLSNGDMVYGDFSRIRQDYIDFFVQNRSEKYLNRIGEFDETDYIVNFFRQDGEILPLNLCAIKNRFEEVEYKIVDLCRREDRFLSSIDQKTRYKPNFIRSVDNSITLDLTYIKDEIAMNRVDIRDLRIDFEQNANDIYLKEAFSNPGSYLINFDMHNAQDFTVDLCYIREEIDDLRDNAIKLFDYDINKPDFILELKNTDNSSVLVPLEFIRKYVDESESYLSRISDAQNNTLDSEGNVIPEGFEYDFVIEDRNQVEISKETLNLVKVKEYIDEAYFDTYSDSINFENGDYTITVANSVNGESQEINFNELRPYVGLNQRPNEPKNGDINIITTQS